MMMAAGAAHAQDADATNVDEIVVTGIRGSIESALERKRNSNVVMESVTSEDIGRFSNENVAEALQRVPGVQIDREGGEGRFVSIRGLGPQFNRTTVNGRTAVSVGEGGTTANRAFNFDTLATEYIARIDVFKTPTAAMDEGGLGGIIDIQTVRPLDLRERPGDTDGRVFRASYETTWSDLVEQWDPKFSAILSQRFGDDLGILVGVVYNRRSLRQDLVDVPNYDRVTVAGNSVWRPGNIRFALNDQERERLGSTVAIQWRPADWEFNFDWLHSEFSEEGVRDQLQHPVPATGAGVVNQVLSSDGSQLETYTVNNTNMAAFNQLSGADTVSDYYGLNASRQFGDWKIEADVSVGEVAYESSLRSYLGNYRRNVSVDLTGPIPFVSTSVPIDAASIPAFTAHTLQINLIDTEEREYAGQLDFSRDLAWGPVERISFGVKQRDRDTDVVFNVYSYANAALVAGAGATGTSLTPQFRPFPYDNFLEDYSVSNRQWGTIDTARQFEVFEGLLDYLNPAGFTTDIPDTARSYGVGEKVSSAYAMADLGGEFMGVPFRGNAGVRVAYTASESRGFVYDVGVGTNVPVTAENDYTDVLPSLNLAFDIGEEFVLRLGAARVITRPDLVDLAPTVVVQNVGNASARSGNPALDPFRANQYDLSLEWYDSETRASLAAALFYKDIESFTEVFITREAIPGFTSGDADGLFDVTRPTTNGEGASVTGFELAGYLPFGMFASWLEGFAFSGNMTLLDSETSGIDPVTGRTLGVTGVAKQNYHLMAFYERGPFGIRITRTFRDDFMSVRSSTTTGGPEYTEAYGQWDASATFDLTRNVTASFQAVNIEGEDTRRYAAIPENFRS
ncbi:TonB-dependent receptor, partial [Brevundimonas sp.]|uniref:TonB-dependent receptor n=1 Tax=Brevundimonas sp. TaxID=1871086 RepID=UPI002ABA967F